MLRKPYDPEFVSFVCINSHIIKRCLRIMCFIAASPAKLYLALAHIVYARNKKRCAIRYAYICARVLKLKRLRIFGYDDTEMCSRTRPPLFTLEHTRTRAFAYTSSIHACVCVSRIHISELRLIQHTEICWNIFCLFNNRKQRSDEHSKRNERRKTRVKLLETFEMLTHKNLLVDGIKIATHRAQRHIRVWERETPDLWMNNKLNWGREMVIHYYHHLTIVTTSYCNVLNVLNKSLGCVDVRRCQTPRKYSQLHTAIN